MIEKEIEKYCLNLYHNKKINNYPDFKSNFLHVVNKIKKDD